MSLILILMSKNDELRIALIFLGPFPVGNVSSLRIMSYCKALVQSGVFIKVLIVAPTTEAAVNKQKIGTVDGVHYEYLNGITWKNSKPSKVTKLLAYVLGLFKAFHYIKKNRVNCLLSYHDEWLCTSFFGVVTKFMRIPFIIDKTEYPAHYFKFGKVKKITTDFRLRIYDGFITLTKELQNFYTKILKEGEYGCFLLPMTINPSRFDGLSRTKNAVKPYIAVVFGTHNRDGLFETIKAYNRYLKQSKAKYPMDLWIIGDFRLLCQNYVECSQIDEYISENNIGEKTVYKGLIPIEEIPVLLLNASCLITTPNSFVSGGFPTKLGECLLSGVPVVATSAGEISSYVNDKEHILLSAPGDIENIAANLLFTEENREEALKIALAGQNQAKHVFNADTYIKDLIKFLKQHKKRKQGVKIED
jgi:glycosyltransferase involved in cell wall biosynthesis